MINLVLANGLKPTDIVFFVVLAAIVLVAVGIYFLIPVFNKAQYEQQRENLRKREEAFKSTALSRTDGSQTETQPEEPTTEQLPDVESPSTNDAGVDE